MRKHKHVQHTHKVRGAIMQSVELKVSLRQEWDQTRWPFSPLGAERGERKEHKRNRYKVMELPRAQGDSTIENGCKFIFRDD